MGWATEERAVGWLAEENEEGIRQREHLLKQDHPLDGGEAEGGTRQATGLWPGQAAPSNGALGTIPGGCIPWRRSRLPSIRSSSGVCATPTNANQRG